MKRLHVYEGVADFDRKLHLFDSDSERPKIYDEKGNDLLEDLSEILETYLYTEPRGQKKVRLVIELIDEDDSINGQQSSLFEKPEPYTIDRITRTCTRCGFIGELNFAVVMLNGTHQCSDKAACFERMVEKGIVEPKPDIPRTEYKCDICGFKGKWGTEMENRVYNTIQCIDKENCGKRLNLLLRNASSWL